MNIRTIAFAAALGLSLAGIAHANDLGQVENQAIDLGSVTGDVFYSVRPDGYHVTATLGTRVPLRFEAVLTSGQALTFSTPRALGEQPVSVNIRRDENRIIVTQTPVTN
jgi:hypothetical protein